MERRHPRVNGVDEIVDGPWPWSNLEYVYGEHFVEHPLDGALRSFARRPRRSSRAASWTLDTEPRRLATHFRPAPTNRRAGRRRYLPRTGRFTVGHQFLYSRPMLERLLHAAGFRDVTFHDYGASDVAALTGLERHPGWDLVEAGRASGSSRRSRRASRPDERARGRGEAEFVRYVRAAAGPPDREDQRGKDSSTSPSPAR